MTNTAEKRKEENERLRREVEDKKTRISCMVSAKELEDERRSRRDEDVEHRKRIEELKREMDKRNDMATIKTRTLEKDVIKTKKEIESQRN